jgi:hypothetical protein
MALLAAGAALVALSVTAGACRSTAKTKAPDPVAELQVKVGEEIRSVVKDPATAAKVEAEMKQVLDFLRQMADEDSAQRARMVALNADYGATQGQFDEALAAHRTKRNALRKQVIGIQGRIAGLLTDEEWKKLNALRADAWKLGVNLD